MQSKRFLLWLPALLLVVSCAHKVVSFSVEPPLVCPGQVVSLKWNVQGRASLRTGQGESDSKDEPVPSQGERSLSVANPTAFTIRALDANPADGQSFATRSVDVVKGPVEKAAASTCDAGSGKCRGSFELVTAGSALRVLAIAAPRIVRAGRVQPGRICVSHAEMASTCISGDDKVDVAVGADGVWTLETDLPATETGAPDPQLRVQLGFGCP